jgi:hypothetical protein
MARWQIAPEPARRRAGEAVASGGEVREGTAAHGTNS